QLTASHPSPILLSLPPRPPRPPLFPYTTLFRSHSRCAAAGLLGTAEGEEQRERRDGDGELHLFGRSRRVGLQLEWARSDTTGTRSEEHTSELQSRFDLVCRLLLEKKKGYTDDNH